MTAVSEVPVWVNGVEKWVTGVGKRTTCGDMVKVLLATDRPTDELTDADLKSYAIVERWRKVERPLDPDARILKVWKAWGDDNADVRFTLKKLCPMKPKEMKTLRRRHQSRHRWRSTSSLETIHPRKLGDSGPEGVQHHDMLERLMRMIVAQGETIQAQLRRLQEREELIGYYEHQMHKKRADQLGSDYLLRTYLRDGEAEETEKTSNDSGLVADLCEPAAAAAVGTALPGSSSEQETLQQLQHTLHYLESVVQLNQRICEQEETALRLSHKIRRARTGAEAAGSGGGADTELLLELEVSRTELQRLAAVCARQDAQIEQNERALLEFERLIEDKRRHLRYLEHQLAEADSETERLVSEQKKLDQCAMNERTTTQLSVRSQRTDCYSNPVYTCHQSAGLGVKDAASGDNDSNSDTGLSSLHSSSDEAGVGYVLDTLV